MNNSISCNFKPVYKDINNPYMPSMISIITSRQCARISIDDIEVVEQVGRVVHIVTADRDYQIYDNINNLATMLSGGGFFRPLQCMIVNFDQIKDMEDMYIYFQSGQCTTLGKNAFRKTRAAFRKYLEEYPQFMIWEDSVKVAESKEK